MGKMLNVRVTDEVYEQVKGFAVRDNVTVSDWCRNVICRAIEKAEYQSVTDNEVEEAIRKVMEEEEESHRRMMEKHEEIMKMIDALSI